MKRKITIILTMILIASQFISCDASSKKCGDNHMNSWHESRLYDLYIWFNGSRITSDCCRRIYKAYKDKDVSLIKKEFSKKLLETDDIDEKLENSIKLIDGNIIAYKITMIDAGYDRIMNGHLIRYDGMGIFEIKTDKKRKYILAISCDIVNKEQKDNVGINYLEIDNLLNGKEKEMFKIVQ